MIHCMLFIDLFRFNDSLGLNIYPFLTHRRKEGRRPLAWVDAVQSRAQV